MSSDNPKPEEENAVSSIRDSERDSDDRHAPGRIFTWKYVIWLLVCAVTLIALLEIGMRALGFSLGGGVIERGPCPGMPPGPCVAGRIRNGPAWLFGWTEFRLNSWRDRAPEPTEIACENPVVFIGDSYTYGLLTADDQTVPAIVERSLNPALSACVYNAGRPGDSLRDERIRLGNLFTQAGLKPKVVVHQYYGDDVYQKAGSREALIQGFVRSNLHLIGLAVAGVRLRLAVAWRFRWAQFLLGPADINRYASASDYKKWMSEYAAEWGEFMDELRARDIHLVLWVVPFPANMARADVGHLLPLIAEAQSREIPALVLTRENLHEDPFLPNDLHFNADTNAEIARLLVPLVERALVPR